MGITKSAVGVVDACAEVAQNAVREGAVMDLSEVYDAHVGIQLALTSETAHTGTILKVQISFAETGDEDWIDYHTFLALSGTAESEVITNNPAAAGTTTFTVASTTGFTADGILPVFLKDVSTFANSEWLMLVSAVSNTSVTVLDGSTREHAQNSVFYNVASTHRIFLPLSALRARVLYDNTYDSDGSTIASRSVLNSVPLMQ